MKRLPGKRIQIIEIQTKLRPVAVEIRQEKSGMFFSLFQGERYENTSMDALKQALSTLVRAHEDTQFTFKPFIEYRLVEGERRPHWGKGEKRSFAYVGLEYRVIELSVETVGPAKARLVRPAKVQLDLDAPHFPVSFVETRRYFPDKGTRIVPYTAERLVVLGEIRNALMKLRERLHEFLDVPEDTIGDALDWLHTSRLFPSISGVRISRIPDDKG